MAGEDEARTTQFSLDPQLSLWTNHTREHTLMKEEHEQTHTAEKEAVTRTAQALEKLQDLRWDNHKREHEAGQLAIDKVEKNMETRFAAVNEFREQQKDVIREFARRTEVDAVLDGIALRVDALETHRAQGEGRERGSQPFMAIIISIVTAVLSALAVGAVVIGTRSPAQ